MPARDRIRLAEFRQLCDSVQDSCWPGWSRAPRSVLLVTDSLEYLVWHPRPDSDFVPCGYDSLLGTDVYVRPREFSAGIQATFPYAGMPPTIVIGTADSLVPANSTSWVVTVMHEHFHQWQDSRRGYFPAVDSLGLSGGDKTGMWMLNYPFPYDSAVVADRIERLCRSLAHLIQMQDLKVLHDDFGAYMASRDSLMQSLAPADQRYMSFQLWQEGVARYIEGRVARVAASTENSSQAFEHLADWHSYESVLQSYGKRLVAELQQLRFSKARRLAFYPMGAAEATVLERLRPDWPRAYGFPPLSLENLLKQAAQ